MSAQELFAWNEYFQIKVEQENKAYDDARKQAQMRKVR